MAEHPDTPSRQTSPAWPIVKSCWRGFAVAMFFLGALPAGLFVYDLLSADYGDVVWSPVRLFGSMFFLPLYPFLWAEKWPLALRLVGTAIQVLALASAFGWFTRNQAIGKVLSQGVYGFLSLTLLATALFWHFAFQ